VAVAAVGGMRGVEVSLAVSAEAVFATAGESDPEAVQQSSPAKIKGSVMRVGVFVMAG